MFIAYIKRRLAPQPIPVSFLVKLSPHLCHYWIGYVVTIDFETEDVRVAICTVNISFPVSSGNSMVFLWSCNQELKKKKIS